MAKITKATFKSFMKRHESNMMVRSKSAFDGMTDGCVYKDSGWKPLEKVRNDKYRSEENMGFETIWLVGSSRDRFNLFDDGEYTGIEVYNCCCHFIVAIKKAA